MKIKSFTLIELIVSITIMSVIIIFSMIFFQNNLILNKKNVHKEIQKIDILSFKIFIQKALERSNIIIVSPQKIKFDSDNLYIKDQTIYYNTSIILENINFLKFSKNKFLIINICSKTICQKLVFNL